MTTQRQHEEQAKADLALHDFLMGQDRDLDWAVTVLAYAALHYIDAFLLPDDPRDHGARNSLIRKTQSLRTVWRDYRFLLKKSRDARYECYDPTPKDVAAWRKQHYDRIEGHVRQLLQGKN